MNFIFKLTLYINNFKHQIVKFFIVGCSSVLIDMVLLIVLKEKFNFSPTFAVATNQIFVISYNFLLNKYWSFETKKVPVKQFGRYTILVIFNYLISIGLMYLLYNIFRIDYKIVRLFSIAMLFVINFILYKDWVYKEK